MARAPRDPDDYAVLTKTGRLDPAKVDVGAPKKRKRKPKPRKVPDPPEELRKWAVAAEKRMFTRPYPPGVLLEPAGFDEEHWSAPHSDHDLWSLQMADAFGSRSHAVLVTFSQQLEALCGRNIWDEEKRQWRLDEHELSAALAIVNSVKPRNELEAAHAAQMVAVHLMTMKVSARALRYDYEPRMAAVAGKLARTFTLQREAFERIRKPNRTAKQNIKVTKELHQHVHYHHESGPRGAAGSDGQSDAPPAAQPPEIPALPGPEEERGRVVPITRGSRKARVPNARG